MDAKLKELIDETVILKETLEKLNDEIHSYKTAKESLASVKEKMITVSETNLEIVESLKKYLEKIDETLNEELINSVKSTENNVKTMLVNTESFKNSVFEEIDQKSSLLNKYVGNYSKIIIGLNIVLTILIVYLAFIK